MDENILSKMNNYVGFMIKLEDIITKQGEYVLYRKFSEAGILFYF